MSSFTFGQVVEAAAKAGGSSDLDPGIYDVEIIKVTDGTQKNDPSVKTVSISIRVTEGMDKGKRAYMNYSAKGLGFKFLVNDLNALGIKTEELSALTSEDITNRVGGTFAKIEATTSPSKDGSRTFTNYKVLSAESGVVEAPAASSGSLPWDN